jgi:tripartite-type tricarboxylate transporter receptor subunit TctC
MKLSQKKFLAVRAVALAAVAALALTACSKAATGASDAPFYEGKKVTLYVPYAAGGGTDLAARALAPLLSKFLPGKPTVIVENDPSTAGIIGANEYAAKKKHDGTVILMSSSALHSAYLVQDPTVKVDFNALRPVLGMATGSLVFVSSKTGIKEPKAIIESTREPLILAGQTPSGSDLRTLLALDLLGVKYKPIFGYEGSGDKRIAFERGEVNLMLDNSISYRKQMGKLAERGEVVPIMSQGLMVGAKLERVASLPDLPTPTELYQQLKGKEATGPEWDAYRTLVASTDSLSKGLWLHGKDPQAAHDALLNAFTAIIADKDAFAPLKDDVFGGNAPLMGADLDGVVDAMANPKPEARKYLQTYLKDRWDVS